MNSMKAPLFVLALFLSIFWTVLGSLRNQNGVHLPWYHDAVSYWDFDEGIGDSKGRRVSEISGDYNFVPGPKDNAIEFVETSNPNSYLTLGNFSDTCLPDPSRCKSGFTISFWVNLKKVLHDGVLLQLALSRNSRGITINTEYKNGKISLQFTGNTPKRRYRIDAHLLSHIWHHVALVWNATAEQKMSLFVNCTGGDVFKPTTKNHKNKKREDKFMILGANHSGKKSIPIAVDDFAIWFKPLKLERFCEMINQRRVHGNYSSWSEFSSCSVTCGSGTKTRTRKCNNPFPDYGGRNCSSLGPSSETVECNGTVHCPIPGSYTPWSKFSKCSVSCGGLGTRYRTRNCTDPEPQYGGQDCSYIGSAMETENCHTGPCPIDGGYTPWSSFSDCSVLCGGGSHFRTRSCNNPKPQYGGQNCSIIGPAVEAEDCNNQLCPIPGGYTSWSEFSNCSVPCGGGSRYRTRNCTDPEPQYGGQNCSNIGPAIETEECNSQPCPIHGSYTPWSEFSNCSVPCGGGLRHRTRNCTNPEPQYGGQNCSNIGPAIETEECNSQPCPIHGGYAPWSNFSECSVSCGGGGTRYRTRNCTNPEPQYGGQNCSNIGPAIEPKTCSSQPCPIHGGYTPWSNFLECSVSCGGGGTRYRTRNCTNPEPQYGGQNCFNIGPAIETEECNSQPCPIHGGYTPWSNFSECSVSCGVGGTRYRTRNCTNPEPQYCGQNCSNIGPAIEVRTCNSQPCPIDGGYTPWSNFSECSVSCGGGGTRYRSRNCTNPLPNYGGQNCSQIGPPLYIQACNRIPCPVHGNYSAWSAFSPCSTSCGDGYRSRNRTCTSPIPKHGGRNCSELGPDREIEACHLQICPIHGGFSEWSNFSACSQTCGNSTKTRTRTCNNPTPSHGGRHCEALGPHSDTVSCQTPPCPIHGNYSDWSEFSPCLRTCGNSSKFRLRYCTNPEPRFGGKNCSGLDFEEVLCYQAPCPVHGNFSEWSLFSKCSRTCGNGTRKRYRNCTEPTPMHGGNDCSSLGSNVQIRKCNERPCPVDGDYSLWLKFGPCSQTCGNGTQFRTRHCNNPLPRFGGRNCSTLGPSNDTRSCNLRPCPIHGNLSQWSEFSGCSKTCGFGVKIRYRYCTNPVPRHGGDNCTELGSTSDVISCHVRPCPVHGNYSTWSPFGSCSKSCDNGTQLRRRFCTNPSPRFGGRDCSFLGPNVDTRHCQTQRCPDIDFTVKFKLHITWTSELLDNTSEQYQNLSKELKTPIFGLHRNQAIKEIKILEYSPGSVVVTMEVIYYSRSFPGTMALYDAFYIDRRIGPYEVTPLFFTSTDVPTSHVQNITVFNRSSTSLALHWSPLSSQPGQGAIEGYSVIFEKLLRPGSVKSNKTMIAVFLNATKGTLSQLNKYSWYKIRIAGRNKRGTGVPSDPLVALTDEDVPNVSPNLKPVGFNTSSTSLNISWKAIARADVNGVLRGYTVFYKAYSSKGTYHNVTVSPDNVSVRLTDLRKYTEYELRVAGVTSKGTGGMSEKSLVYTDEDVPSTSPIFHAYRNTSSTSIELQWHKVLSNHQNGVILGYCVYYRPRLGNGSWNRVVVGENQTRLTINNLQMFLGYFFRISAFTSKGEGNISESILVSTDEDVPCSAPIILKVDTTNSTSVWLKWSHLAPRCHQGVLRGYTVSYKTKHGEFINATVSPSRDEVTLRNLWKYYVYSIKVAGFTSKGLGPYSEIVSIRTMEDVPSTWPEDIHAHNTSSTSVQVSWGQIPQSRIHGKLKGYHVFLKRAGESEWERIKNYTDCYFGCEIENLWKYTKYVYRVVGYTSVGAGVASPEMSVWTDEDVPSRAPEQFKTINRSSPTSIPLFWKPISDPFYIHGILLGYKVELQKTHVAGKPLDKQREAVIHITAPDTLSYVLTDLEIYAVYKIKITAFTVKGDGLASEIFAETCKCASVYKTNWWSNPPYIYKNESKISGIFPLILPDMVSRCCEFCHEHGKTVTYFEGQKQSAPSYHKSGVSEFRSHVGDTAELHFPMYGQVHQEKYYKRYEFIPLVESPGVIFLVLDDDIHLASMLMLYTIADTLPIVLLMITSICIIGIITWFVEASTNNSQFPPSLLHGVFHGIWWSMVSMTTIGYGDKCPRSIGGRIIGICWILTGSIIMSLYISIVTSHITTEVAAEKLKLYGTKVAVIQNSSEHQLAVRKNAHPDLEHPYNNLYDIYNALNKRYVKGALVDAYSLGSRRDLFDSIGVRISKIYDYSSAYGLVLAGEANKLQKCFRGYVSENRKDIFKIIEEHVHRIKQSDVTTSVKRTKSLIDPTFIVYRYCFFISAMLLCLGLLLGVLYEYFKKRLQRTFRCTMFKTDISKKKGNHLTIQKSLNYEMQKTMVELKAKLKRLKDKHRREVKRWIKLKKSIRRSRRPSEDSLIFSTSVVRYEKPYHSPLLTLRKLMSNSSELGNGSQNGRLQEETIV